MKLSEIKNKIDSTEEYVLSHYSAKRTNIMVRFIFYHIRKEFNLLKENDKK